MIREEPLLNISSFILIGATIIKSIESDKTISRLAQSGAEPLFIIATIITTLALWQYRAWRFTAISLGLLTAFSITSFPHIHLAFTILFFVSSTLVIARDKRLNKMAILLIGSTSIIPFSFLWFEVVAISVIIGFHAIYLWWNSVSLRSHLF